MNRRVVAVTGAGGFIGSHLCARLARDGWEVRAMVRDPQRHAQRTAQQAFLCDLPDRIDESALRGASVLLHAAWVTRHTSLEEARRVNDAGTRRLLELARGAGVERVVFISSQSAHREAVSYYGRSKKAVEEALDPARDLIVRPGLVLGAGSAGLFERMCDTVRRSRVIPLFGGGRQPLQTVHIDDLAEAIAAAIAGGHAGLFTVAETEPIAMGAFLRLIASRLGRRPWFVPFPIAPALAALRAVEALRLPCPVSSENLLGLRQMRAAPTGADLERLGVRIRPAAASLDDLLSRETI